MERIELPSTQALEQELHRVRYGQRYRAVLKSTVYTLITVAAAAVLVATLWLPVLQIYGSSMAPTLEARDIVLALKGSDVEQGDVIAFYHSNKLLVKRVIARAGQWVDLDEQGRVYVDGKPLQEPYVSAPALGETDIELP